MTMKSNHTLTIGFDWDAWYDWGIIDPLTIDISPASNSHILISGLSGGGKTFCEQIIYAKLALKNLQNDSKSEFYFADYKNEDMLSYLRGCKRYFAYKDSLEALNIVYEKMQKRQTGQDEEKYPITLIIDEYVSFMVALQSEDKKTAALAMNKVSEILMLGRSLSVRLFVSCQRPDASVFPLGSRLNFGIIIILGAPIRSIYEMLIPSEFIDRIGEREFKTGEGIVLLQGSVLRFIKVPIVQDMDKMRKICIKALS